MADFFGVTTQTWDNWEEERPEVFWVLKGLEGRDRYPECEPLLVVIATDRRIVDFLLEKGQKLPADSRVIGIGHEGVIVGALIYARWRWEAGRLIDVELSVYCDRPESFTRGVQRAMLDYPFAQLRVERVTVLVEHGTTAHRMAIYHGFDHEGTMRRLHGPDQMVYGRLNNGD